MDYVYAVRESNYEAAWVVSLHRTYKGAYTAMKASKINEFNWWRNSYSHFRKTQKWDQGHWWQIVKMEIQP